MLYSNTGKTFQRPIRGTFDAVGIIAETSGRLALARRDAYRVEQLMSRGVAESAVVFENHQLTGAHLAPGG